MNGWLIVHLAALFGLGIYAGHRVVLTGLWWRVRKSAGKARELVGEAPRITVQLPIFNERFVAERLLEAAAGLDWPAERLQIQVLDDSTDDTVDVLRAACERHRRAGVDIEYRHRGNRVGFKAGALEAGLATASGEFILILDADFLPPADLLQRMIPEMTDARVGMVQVRWEHINRDYSLLTEVQALLLDGHFGIEQTTRARTGRLFNFNGTAGMWRREAIASSGGWQHDTLTEDLDLSYRALLAGWEFRYLPNVVAPAELPVPMSGFKSQQFRWAKGSIQVARKLLPRVLRDGRLSAAARVEGFFHLTQNIPYLLTAVLAVTLVPALVIGPRPSGIGFASLDVALLIGTVGTLAAYCASAEHSIGKSALAAVLRLPALIAITVGISINQSRAVLEGAFGTSSPFVRTPKSGITSKKQRAPSRYRGKVGLIPLAEILLAGYFVLGAALAAHQGRYLALPALAIFAIGFAYVGGRSALRR